MDLRIERYVACVIYGVADSFEFHGPLPLGFARLMNWLSAQRTGEVTVRVSAKPIDIETLKTSLRANALDSVAQLDEPEILSPPEPTPDDTYESYYAKCLVAFNGEPTMAEYVANEEFGRPQLPWLGDSKVARFIHMNASHRLYDQADPTEYQMLKDYVSTTFPELFATLSLKE